MPEVLTVEQAAQYLQLNPETVRRAARSGRLPAARVGRRWRFHKTTLEQWLAQGGSDYERIVDAGLLALADRAEAASKGKPRIPLEEVQRQSERMP